MKIGFSMEHVQETPALLSPPPSRQSLCALWFRFGLRETAAFSPPATIFSTSFPAIVSLSAASLPEGREQQKKSQPGLKSIIPVNRKAALSDTLRFDF